MKFVYNMTISKNYDQSELFVVAAYRNVVFKVEIKGYSDSYRK